MRDSLRLRSSCLARPGGRFTTLILSAWLAVGSVGCSAFAVDAATSTTTLVTTPGSSDSTTTTTTTTTTTSTTTTTTTSPTSTPGETTTTIPTTTTTAPGGAVVKPDWIGVRPLPIGREGYGINLPTPPLLQDRRFVTQDILPPPVGLTFEGTILPVTPDIAARSSWREGCPVRIDQLRYLTMSYWGFDGRPHTGEMITNSSIANGVIAIFQTLYNMKFPIEEMRITSLAELAKPPTGDQNRTESFVCRKVVGNPNAWSRHALGQAVDINPFHNPYYFRGIVYPELASAYVDRTNVRPGMIFLDDSVVAAFHLIGFNWGGTWSSKDWMHFSDSGG